MQQQRQPNRRAAGAEGEIGREVEYAAEREERGEGVGCRAYAARCMRGQSQSE